MTALRTVWLVARRELRTRVLDRTFLVSTIVVVALIGAAVALPLVLGGTDEYTVAVAGEEAVAVAEAAAGAADPDDLVIGVERVADAPEARALVGDGEADAALVAGGPDGGRLTIVAEGRPENNLAGALQQASAQVRRAAVLDDAGIEPAVLQRALEPDPLPVESLSDVEDADVDAGLVAFVGSILLYGQLLGYCVWVASGVVEEKSSRVVEVLLATVPPRRLLAGKILGIGIVGMLQLLVIAGLGLGAVLLVGDVQLPPQTSQVAAGVLLWFVLGFAFYSCAYAVAGSLVSRQEDVQATSTPLTVLILASFFVSFPVAQSPDTTFAQVVSFIPPVAPLVVPGRMAAGVVEPLELVASALVAVAASVVLVRVAARLYEGSILRTGGRVSVREAWSRRAA